MGMIGSKYWRHPDTKLKKCSERTRELCTDHDDCCAVTQCDFCVELEIYGEAEITPVSTSRSGDNWIATIGGYSFRAFWHRDEYDVCSFVVELDGEEVYRKSCYEGQSCRDSSDETEVTIGYESGTLRWIKQEPLELPHIDHPDTGCKTWFCGECECSCKCVCVTITDPDGTISRGELCNTAYECEGPIWSGMIGYYDLSLVLDRDEYTGECIITAKVGGEEQDAVFVTGCKDMSATITLYDGTAITVACKRCGCNDNGPLPCCPGFLAPDTLHLDVTLNAGDCSCFALVGGSYSVTLYLVNRLPDYYEYHGIRLRPSGCNGGSSESTNVYDGFVFICRIDATEGAELSVLQELSPVANPQPTIPITVTPDHAWVQDFAARSVNTEDCIFPLFVFEFDDSHALDSCEAEPPTDVTIVVYA